MKHKITKPIHNLFLVLRNWTFQSYLYVERTELFFKLLFEAIIFTLIIPVLSLYFSGKRLVVGAAVITHTISWSFNGDIHVLRKSIGLASTQPVSRKLAYLYAFCERASQDPSIQSVGIVGSATRGEMTQTSDIDVRIIRNPGITPAIGASLFLLRERSRALYYGMPLDCYLYDNLGTFEKDAESPIILAFDSQGNDIREQFQKIVEMNS